MKKLAPIWWGRHKPGRKHSFWQLETLWQLESRNQAARKVDEGARVLRRNNVFNRRRVPEKFGVREIAIQVALEVGHFIDVGFPVDKFETNHVIYRSDNRGSQTDPNLTNFERDLDVAFSTANKNSLIPKQRGRFFAANTYKLKEKDCCAHTELSESAHSANDRYLAIIIPLSTCEGA